MTTNLLEVRRLRTHFFTRWGIIKAVDDISFDVKKGETLGIVGESGSGKSITSLSIMRLVPQPAGRILGGVMNFKGEDLLKKSDKEMRRIRGNEIGMILQDPMSSLNPVFTVGNQITEVLKRHTKADAASIQKRAEELFELVGIPSPKERLRNYPHQLSGGMKQRIVGAIALSGEPDLLIADEPTTSLDTTVQAQFLRLFKGLQKSRDLSMIFITHDFGVVAKTCDRVAVMYAGKIIEQAPVRELFDTPCHPYTRALMKSVPNAKKNVARLESIEGQPPALNKLPKKCSFLPRCLESTKKCKEQAFPPVTQINTDHLVSCWKYI